MSEIECKNELLNTINKIINVSTNHTFSIESCYLHAQDIADDGVVTFSLSSGGCLLFYERKRSLTYLLQDDEFIKAIISSRESHQWFIGKRPKERKKFIRLKDYIKNVLVSDQGCNLRKDLYRAACKEDYDLFIKIYEEYLNSYEFVEFSETVF